MTQIIYGIHPVEEALKSKDLKFQKILFSAQKTTPPLEAILDLASKKKVSVSFASKESLDRMAKNNSHQNIIAVIEEIPYVDLEEVLSRGRKKGPKVLLLILDGIQDPQNFGSLIRTSLGCGVNGVIIPKDRAVGITPAVIKASAGAIAHLPVARVVNIANTIDELKKEGIWVYGAAGEANDPIYQLDLYLDLAIVIGAEEKGIRPLVRKKCDRLFSIPMKGPVSSFNASVSGGIILYEVMRQRDIKQAGALEL